MIRLQALNLLQVPDGPKTVATLRTNVVVGVQYLEAWLGGLGCVPLYNLMEDAATAEICRTQVILPPRLCWCREFALMTVEISSGTLSFLASGNQIVVEFVLLSQIAWDSVHRDTVKCTLAGAQPRKQTIVGV